MNNEIRQKLLEMQDLKYKEFHSGLCPNVDDIIGVRVPVLRDFAKELLKHHSVENLLEEIGDTYYEELQLQGMVIGLCKEKDFKVVAEYIRNFVPKINSWAVCDTFCAGLKITRKHPQEMWELIKPYFASEQEFEIRFAVVMLLDYYVDEEHLEVDLEILDQIKSEKYYVRMAVAWALSLCLVKFYDRTRKYLLSEGCSLDLFTYNKALQKAVESYRLTSEQKDEMRRMKRGERDGRKKNCESK